MPYPDPELIVIFGAISFIVLISVAFPTISGVLRTRARERTKRELAAYVAEGSMRPEDAERILEAGPGSES